MEKEFCGIKNYNVAVQETASGIVFLRKIVAGGTDKSYGIHVARLAGLPFSALSKAEKRLKTLEKTTSRKMTAPASKTNNPQFSLFEKQPIKYQKLEEALRSLDLNNLAPLDALKQLFEMKKLL